MIYASYHARCDNCGAKFELNHGEGNVWFPDQDCLQMCMQESDWETTVDDKDICPDCFQGYDDEDNLILKQIDL